MSTVKYVTFSDSGAAPRSHAHGNGHYGDSHSTFLAFALFPLMASDIFALCTVYINSMFDQTKFGLHISRSQKFSIPVLDLVQCTRDVNVLVTLESLSAVDDFMYSGSMQSSHSNSRPECLRRMEITANAKFATCMEPTKPAFCHKAGSTQPV